MAVLIYLLGFALYFFAVFAAFVLQIVDLASGKGSDVLKILHVIVEGILALVGSAVPMAMKDIFINSAVEYLRLMAYFSVYAERKREKMHGQLDQLLNLVNNFGGYKQIHIVGFSLGSLFGP